MVRAPVKVMAHTHGSAAATVAAGAGECRGSRVESAESSRVWWVMTSHACDCESLDNQDSAGCFLNDLDVLFVYEIRCVNVCGFSF